MKDDDLKAEQAQRQLAELTGAGDRLGRSLLADAAKRAGAHLRADDAPADDFAERWGRRIGRVAAAFAVLWLIYSLLGGI